MADELRPQTAVQGVAFGTSMNVLSKVLNYSRQVLITAYFGLSGQLDAFFVATSVVGIFINTFGDIFDSVGIPSLVRVRERAGEDAFRSLTGSIFSLALFLGIGLSVLMFFCFPLAPMLVPGLSSESKGFIRWHLYLLLPYALVFLPYHALGSFFRSLRGFHVYYVVELLVQFAALVAVFAFGFTVLIVPVSLSVAYILGLLAFVFRGRKRFRFRGNLSGGEMSVVRKSVSRMMPIYMILYGLIITDRYFASFLEVGAISALSYGYILATAIPGIMNIENVIVTPLAEDSDRGTLLTRILSGIWIVSLPIVVFTLYFADELVRGLFERGAFTAKASGLTSDALRFYILGVPAFFALPICVRTLQIFRKFTWITILSVISVLMNACLNYLLVLKVGMGVKGVALSTSLSMLVIGACTLRLLHGLGVRIRFAEMAGVLPNVLVGITVSLAVSATLPLDSVSLPAIGARGTVFVLFYVLVAFLLPGNEVRRLRNLLLESFPRVRRFVGRIP